MPRKGHIAKRDVLPDPIYNSKVVTRTINSIMLDGKKGTAQTILYNAFDRVKEATGQEPLEVFNKALENYSDDNINIKELGDSLLLDSGTLTPLLKKMENKGYIQREKCCKDCE